MSLKIITHWEEGLGTVAKGIMADTQEDYALLWIALVDMMPLVPNDPGVEPLRKLIEHMRKNPPPPKAGS